MSSYGGFVRGGEHADIVEQQQTTGTGVVILAPKKAANSTGGLDSRPTTILNIRKALQKSAGGRALSPGSPAAGRRRGSPTYEAFPPRGSPTYEPLTARRSPDHEPQHAAAALGQSAGGGESRSRSGSRSRSRSRSRRRHHRSSSSKDGRKRRRRSRSSSPTRHKDTHRSTHHKNSSRRHRRSRSHSRSSRRRRRSSRRDSSRSRERHLRRHDSSYSGGSGGRRGSLSPVPFSRQEKSRAWAEERVYNTDNPVRRGKQGLGFGEQQQQHEAARHATRATDSTDRNRSSSKTPAGAAAASSHTRSVSTLDAAALIPGYASMTAAEKLKARMLLVMSKAEQQGAGVDGRIAAGLGSHGLGSTEAGVVADGGDNGWTRFVFDRHGELDEDKQARQKLMDAEVGKVAMGGFGNAADDTLDTSAAFIMGTGRLAAQRTGLAQAAEAAHDDAIFGRPYGGSTAAGDIAGQSSQGLGSRSKHTGQQQQHMQEGAASGPVSNGHPGLSSIEVHSHDEDAKQLAASLGVAEVLIAEQQKPGSSWRDRALAMRAKRQQ